MLLFSCVLVCLCLRELSRYKQINYVTDIAMWTTLQRLKAMPEIKLCSQGRLLNFSLKSQPPHPPNQQWANLHIVGILTVSRSKMTVEKFLQCTVIENCTVSVSN